MSAPSIRRHRSNRVVVGLVTAAAVTLVPALVLAGPASGQPDPDAPTKDGVAQSVPEPAAPPAPACDLNAGDHQRDEFAHCTNVVVSAASSPELGGTTSVDVSVTSVADIDSGTLTVLVNDRLALVEAPGFSVAGTKPSGVGPMTAVSRTISVDADQTETFSFEVTGERAGIGVVQAKLNTAGGMLDGGDELSVQLGQMAPVSDRGGRTVAVPADAALAPAAPSPAPNATPPTPDQPATQRSPGAPNASCATGGWRFNDENGVSQPSRNFRVQIWDQDAGGDDLLAQGYTNSSGQYNICFESTDGEGGGQEVYVRFLANAVAWRVRNTAASDTDYAYVTGVFNYADPGGTHNFGTLQPANGAEHRALHAFDGISRLWLWHTGIHNYLDNPGQSRQMIVNWTPTSTDGTYYSLAANDIHLAAADPDSDHTTIHEGAHALMDAIYNDDFPPAPNCNPHSIFGPSSTGCAWTEGWAEWVPARVLNDPFYRWADGASLNLETPSWHNFTGAYGDTAEGRIAGALIDLSDSANESYWDRYSEGGSSATTEEIYATNLIQVSDTLNEYFLTDRPGEGDTGYYARAALFQNTIDYTHRDPLVSGQTLTRPSLASAPNPHRYSYTASSSYWGGTAIRMSADYDLRLYSDVAQSTLLGTSAAGGTTTDYVLVDGNHRTGTFFPRADLFSGSGEYQIEQVTGGSTLPIGTTSSSVSSSDILRVYDASVAAGQTNYVRVVPSGGLDVELFAHDSGGTSATATQGRSAAIAVSSGSGAGGAESLSYSSGDADWTGIVILNKGGSGSYTIYRDVAAPSSPSVLIDGGNPSTYDATVNLTLSATAANTPVAEMQISTDGAFDSEAWQPYSTSATTTLPPGLGVKTVWVRYRSAAGVISSPASDTINRVATPTCDGLTATVAGFGTVNGTPGNDVIVGGPGSDTINGFGGNDVICGLGGADTVVDGPGADTVFGGGGKDTFRQSAVSDPGDVFNGGGQDDTISYELRATGVAVSLNGIANDGAAGEGDLVASDVEIVVGGSGADNITGSGAANTIIGNSGNDVLNGGGGNDVLRGDAGNDLLRGDGGNDEIRGGAGNDTVDEGAGANGADTVEGNAGTDRITYGSRSSAVTIRLNGNVGSGAGGEGDRVIGFEEAVGGSGGDTILGRGAKETLIGGGGNDTIHGRGGHDSLQGGAGNDTLNGNAGNDTANGGGGNDAIRGDAGKDTLLGKAGRDWLHSRDGVNGNDSVNGGPGRDRAVTDPGDTVNNVP